MLVVSEVSKNFAGVKALENLSARIAPGELTVLLGPSGSGKTTLLRCISMLDPPDSGQVEIDGRVWSSSNFVESRVHPDVGVVFQNLALWPHLSLRENILLPLRVRGGEVEHSYLDALIETFGMIKFIDRFPRQVSGGEKQRAAIVRALVLRPRYLLLDEITSALDVEQIVKLLHELERLKREGVGILLITHLLGFARRAANSFIFLDEGRVTEQGPIARLEAPESPRLQRFLRNLAEAS